MNEKCSGRHGPDARLPGEGEKAYAAFLVYRSIRKGRSVPKAFCAGVTDTGLAGTALDTWRGWSRLYAWRARAEAADRRERKSRCDAWRAALAACEREFGRIEEHAAGDDELEARVL